MIGEGNHPDLLELVDVSKVIGDRKILNRISFRFRRGKRYYLAGANGSGKTTLFKVIASRMRATRGQVRYEGRNIADLDGQYLRKVAFLSHELNMYEELSGLDNLEFFGQVYRVPRPWERAMELIERVGLRLFANERVKYYSRGMRQRLAVAKALLHDPTVLLFDEPFAGLDLRGVAMLEEIIDEMLPKGQGLFILATHDPGIAWRLTDHYLYLERGTLQSYGGQERYVHQDIERKLREARDVGVY
ncbi:MAG: ATP-binding cassette domain-containing protein [Candidatus Bipolaricaulia bacterium]